LGSLGTVRSWSDEFFEPRCRLPLGCEQVPGQNLRFVSVAGCRIISFRNVFCLPYPILYQQTAFGNFTNLQVPPYRPGLLLSGFGHPAGKSSELKKYKSIPDAN